MTDSGTRTSPTPEELTLAADFPPASAARWRELVAGVLRKSGALPADFTGDPTEPLTSTSYDGVRIQPLYTAEDAVPEPGYPGLPPFVRGATPAGATAAGWDIRARFDDPDPAKANEAILADLDGGVRSVWLRIGSGGLPLDTLPEVLSGIYLDMVGVVLDAGAEAIPAARALLERYTAGEIPAGAVHAGLGLDPIGLLAKTGRSTSTAEAAELAAKLAGGYPRLRAITVDALPYHEAGGSDSQELGAAIATGVAYLRALTDAGLSAEQAFGQVEFRFAATVDQFLTIAKLRAARRLWARVGELSEVPSAARGMRQHAVTAPAMFTQRDPWVNMLRGTIACFAAGIGGADAITVLPFDSAIGRSDAFARRIARNTQAILLDESKLARVLDPAGGSWYVERLTDELARVAWREFTEIEKAGGIEASLGSGELADRLAATMAARRNRLATRADPITGVSEFADVTERSLERPANNSTVDGGLPSVRYAAEYEALRDRSDAHLAETGSRPRVFLATLGPVAAHTARATFASNLFQAGGIEPINPGELATAADVAAAFRASGTNLACLCGADAAYAEQAAEVAAALRAAGAKAVWLAGKPADFAGVTGYLYTGCVVLDVLVDVLATLGVA